MNARHLTWEDKIASNKGKIDVNLAQEFLSSHEDSFTGKVHADARTLCGHIDSRSARCARVERPAYYPDGAVTGR